MITALAAPARRPATVVLAVVMALVVAVLVPATARAADAGAEQAFVAAVNRERAAAGLPALAVAGDLVAVARRHAVRMADAADLHHNPNLTGEVGGWQKVGENVGRGPSVEAVQDAFMASPGHRANVLSPDWTAMGAAEWRVTAILAGLILVASVGTAVAYQAAPASVVGTFDFAYVGFALIWGMIFFAERPDGWTIAGSLLIVGSGIYTFLRERQIARAMATPADAGPV